MDGRFDWQFRTGRSCRSARLARSVRKSPTRALGCVTGPVRQVPARLKEVRGQARKAVIRTDDYK